ncbi:hypothetical protein ACWPKS_08135 [Coraliomargarita sp. W4R72]
MNHQSKPPLSDLSSVAKRSAHVASSGELDDPIWVDASQLRIGRFVVNRALFFGGVVICFICLCIGLGYWAALNRSREPHAVALVGAIPQAKVADTMELVPGSDDRDYSALAQIMRAHSESVSPHAFSSLTASGVYTTSGVEFEFSLLAKEPGYFRQTLRYEKLEIVVGFDGQNYWQENPVAQAMGDPEAASDVNRDILLLESAQTILLWQVERQGYRGLRLGGTEVLDGRECQLVINTAWLDVPVRHWIDLASGQELQREAILKRGEIPLQVVIHYFEVPQVLVEQSIPSTDEIVAQADEGHLNLLNAYRITMNGTEMASARFDSIRTNQGVMPWMFDQARVAALK